MTPSADARDASGSKLERAPGASEAQRAPGARDTILKVAASLFSTKGYAESGLREIAEQAGIRASTVYHHFASKERIYEEIIRIAIDGIAEAIDHDLRSLAPDATPRLRIETCIAAHLRALHANQPFTSTNAQSRIKLPAEINLVIGPMRERYSNFWRDLLDEAKAAGWIKPELETRMLRPLILGTLNRTVAWFDPAHGPLDALSRTMITMLAGIWVAPAPGVPARRPGKPKSGAAIRQK